MTLQARSWGRRMLAGAALILLCAATAMPQQEPEAVPGMGTPRFHVNVHLVNVFVNVTDANGAPVGGLTKDDFALNEDGVPQKIAYFERETEMPLSMVMEIDTSGSVRKDMGVEVRAAKEFLRAMLRPVDHLDLIDFNSSVREVVPFTSDLRHLEWGLDNLDFGPATALYDAIYLGAQNLAPRSGRKVLVVISDGGNTVKDVDYPQALDEAIRSEVMVYSLIDLPILNDAGRDTGGEHALITMSQETGGKYYYAEYGNLGGAFQKISQDLRTQYLIGYYPVQRRTETDFRRIQVTLKSNSSDTLRYRPGYYAKRSPPLDQ
ncbi:MAG TPA: VWA domain-containing protein [Acidobacteriaceae bacterium]|nr:VWA domain-containing protein [Acidobacteriaceae bacterium]